MTNKEAINYILANYFDGNENVKAVVGGDEEYLAMKYAVEALEKQIPKKPLHWDDCEQFYIECPCCGKRYDSRLGYKGCPYCLQAIRLE